MSLPFRFLLLLKTLLFDKIDYTCRLSSVAEQLFCKQQVLGPNPRDGSEAEKLFRKDKMLGWRSSNRTSL
jgi:hypothetical protein